MLTATDIWWSLQMIIDMYILTVQQERKYSDIFKKLTHYNLKR